MPPPHTKKATRWFYNKTSQFDLGHKNPHFCWDDSSTVKLPPFPHFFECHTLPKCHLPKQHLNSMWGIHMSTKKNGVNMSSCGAGWLFWMNVPWFCIKKSCSWLNIDASMLFVSFFLLLKFSPCSLWQQPRKKNLDIQGGKLWVNNIFTIRIHKSCQ